MRSHRPHGPVPVDTETAAGVFIGNQGPTHGGIAQAGLDVVACHTQCSPVFTIASTRQKMLARNTNVFQSTSRSTLSVGSTMWKPLPLSVPRIVPTNGPSGRNFHPIREIAVAGSGSACRNRDL